MNNSGNHDFGLSQRDVNTLINILRKYSAVADVVLFGSRAKGTFKPGSDIDLAVMNNGVSNAEILKIKNDLEESSLPYFVDVVNYPKIKTADLINHIKRVGVSIYKKDEVVA
jgi:predicted nucleotidyltransferase